MVKSSGSKDAVAVPKRLVKKTHINTKPTPAKSPPKAKVKSTKALWESGLGVGLGVRVGVWGCGFGAVGFGAKATAKGLGLQAWGSGIRCGLGPVRWVWKFCNRFALP